MLSGISGFHSPYMMYRYGGSVSRTPRVPAVQNQEAQSQEAQSAAAPVKNRQAPAGATAGFPASSQASSLSSPLPGASEEERPGLLFRQGTDPVELAVRMRIQYEDPDAAKWAQPAEATGAQSVQEAAEEGECQTCERRKYQDGSDDMGVSFQTPTHIAPEEAPAAVRGHEMEHVYREQAKAEPGRDASHLGLPGMRKGLRLRRQHPHRHRRQTEGDRAGATRAAGSFQPPSVLRGSLTGIADFQSLL